MRRCESVAFVVALVALGLGGSAAAQPAPAPAPAPPAPPANDPAEQAYQRGRSHYDLREWDQAIAEFKEAYRLRADAPSLFNIAQSYRLKGDCVQAASFYKTYRRNFPGEKNIDRVDQFITEMDECAKHQPAPSTGTEGGTGGTGNAASNSAGGAHATQTAPIIVQPPPAPPAERANKTLGIAGLAIAGVGAASITAGVLFAVHGQSLEDQVQERATWDPTLDDRGKRANLLAKVFIVAGGAAVIGGGVLTFLGFRTSEHPTATAAIAPTSGGATVTWSGTF